MIYSKRVQIKDLRCDHIDAMFALYSKYYGGASLAIFCEDIKKKDHVILLNDHAERIQGFSTVQMVVAEFEEKPIRVLFSGDTIVEHCYWGRNDLAQEWLKLAGQVKYQAPEIPLYWLLIVKGHRTYRYLSLFSRTYYPTHQIETPPEQKRLMDYLSTLMFADAYDNHKGILHFPNSRGHLHGEWADIPSKDLRHPEVQFFLERNPGYRQGDELVCLCELIEENLKPFSQRIFSQQKS
ncbi:MAG: hypothetical protein ACHQUC_00185 [Chlamydiales bacterium]